MVKLPPKGKADKREARLARTSRIACGRPNVCDHQVPERFRACSTHLAWLAAEKEVQDVRGNLYVSIAMSR